MTGPLKEKSYKIFLDVINHFVYIYIYYSFHRIILEEDNLEIPNNSAILNKCANC